jgi:hypothetical protein
MKEVIRSIIITIISIFITIGIKWISSTLGHEFSLAENIIIGLGFFVAFKIMDVSYSHHKMSENQIKLFEHWKLDDETDRIVHNIRASFFKIAQDAYGKKDLFVTNFMNRVKKLERDIINVAEIKELRVAGNYFLNAENVLDAFEDEENKFWYYTWPIEDGNNKLFDVIQWKQYFEATAKMTKDGKISDIRAILILKDLSLKESPRVKKLLDYYKTTDNMSCKITTTEEFGDICRGDSFEASYSDWGIYGKQLLYINEAYEPNIIGLFIKDKTEILRYLKLFEAMWNYDSVTKPNPSTEKKEISFQELFDFDENIDKVTETQVKVTETQTKIDETQAKVDKTQTKVDKTQTKVDETQAKVDKTQTKVDETQAKVDKTQTKVDETQAKVDKTQTKVDETQTKD